MKLQNFTPEGVEDISYIQYEQMDRLQEAVRDVFRSFQYKQISTPTFEYYDLFAGIDLSVDKDQMYKIIDSNGKLLVLRPDATIPIARMVASNYKNLKEDVKFMYFSNVFRSTDFRAGEKREFVQAGIEYFGNPSTEADVEVVSAAINAVRAAGCSGIKVELGDANYFNGLLEAIDEGIRAEETGIEQQGLDRDTKNQIKNLVERKNVPGLNTLLEELRIDEKYKQVLLQLPFLYGDMEYITTQAESMAVNDTMRRAVENIREIYSRIPVEEQEAISADMGLVNHLDYYSGMIFKLYLKNTGAACGSGGRYDGLMKKFGQSIPATGFGLNMDILFDSVQKEIDGASDPTQMTESGVLSIALGKGRLAEITMEKLAEIGVTFPDYSKSSRKLIFEDSTGGVRIVFVKAGDVDIYVEKGACDVGVAGKDTLLESDSDVYEMMDLGYGKCRFAVAALSGFQRNQQKKIRVATKYPNVAKAFFEKKGQAIEIIKINGSVELAPIVGLSDVIVDIVETGTTLKENGLEVIETIENVSARLIVNRVSLKLKEDAVRSIIQALQ